MKISYECSDYTNYDFITIENPINDSELKTGEYIQNMSMAELLKLLKTEQCIIVDGIIIY